MIKIKLSNPIYNFPLIRQTPNEKGIWGDCVFYINQEVKQCDFWVVYDGLKYREKTRCPQENTILITGEPPSIKTYNNKFVNQFSTVITCQSDIKHPNKIETQQALAWLVGIRRKGRIIKENYSKNYDELKSTPLPKKTKLLSAVISNKQYTPGHRLRLDFINKIKEYFKNDIDIFGTGINEIEDKWDALAPYKYHLAIENSFIKNYWTEKLADSFLAGTYPFYFGCPNIKEYFSSGGFSNIDINDIEGSIKIIKDAVQKDIYAINLPSLIKNKTLILDKYNLFPIVTEIIKKCKKNTTPQLISISPEDNSCFAKKIKNLITNYIACRK